MSHILAQGLDYFLGNKGYGAQIKEEIEEQRLESARKVLQGQRPQAELEKHKKNKKLVLMRRSWSPPANTPIIGLVYICHGYTEHMANYNGLGEYLSDSGFKCFGTDLIGHGLSDSKDGYKAFIPDFAECRADILMHIEDERRRHGLNLPVFAVAHSMGGMLTIRLALDVPDLFSAIVLVGPLVLFGSSPIMRHLPVSSIWPPLNGLAQWLKKKLTPLADILDWRFQIGHTEVANATKDPYMQHLLKADSLRHFGGVYLPMLTGFSQEIANNLRDMGNMTTPFCILFGSDDPLCNIGGAWQMYFSCHRVRKVDKVMMEFEHAAHQLFMEIPPVREKAMKETLDFLLART